MQDGHQINPVPPGKGVIRVWEGTARVFSMSRVSNVTRFSLAFDWDKQSAFNSMILEPPVCRANLASQLSGV